METKMVDVGIWAGDGGGGAGGSCGNIYGDYPKLSFAGTPLTLPKKEEEDYEWEFTEGDSVWLKSGGPEMTVCRIEGGPDWENLYHCKWFVMDNLHSGVFPEEALERRK